MLGQTANVRVVGFMFGAGKADIEISIIETSGESRSLIARFDLETRGFQSGDLQIRGQIRKESGSHHDICI